MALGAIETHRSLRFLLAAACAIIIIAALRGAASLLIPVAVAFFLSQLCLPIMKSLLNRRVPRPLAVALTLAVVIVLFSGILLICVNVLKEFQLQVREYVGSLRVLSVEWGQDLQARGIEGAAEFLPGIFDPQAAAIVRFVNQTDILGRITSLFSTTFFVFILTVFMLMESGGVGVRIAAIRKARGPNFRDLQKASNDIQRYVGIKTLVSAVTGTLAGLVTWALGLDFPVLWGMVAFVLNFIPAIGSIIAAIPPVLVALVTGGFGEAIGVLVGYLAINMLLGNFIEPTLLGRRFGVSTLVVILSVLFWGWVWGPVGMFLAVPLTMVVKVMLDTSEDFRWLSLALSKTKVTREAVVDGQLDKVKPGATTPAEGVDPSPPDPSPTASTAAAAPTSASRLS
ncbi:AI-2E family transporter [soil metagenome]